MDNTNNGVSRRELGLIRIPAPWLDRNSEADEARDDSALSADVDETLESPDESAGSVDADDQLDCSGDGAPELDDADVEAHPRFAERDTRGRFNGKRPGPGRPKGCSNYKTLRALELRQRIVDSWDRVNGDRLLDQLAKTDPLEYLKLVAKLLPAERPDRHRVELRKLVLNVAPVGTLPPLQPRQLPAVDPPGE